MVLLIWCLAVGVRVALLAATGALDSAASGALRGVRYTDVDYDVLTDGAREVAGGRSPYARATYRYTPLLAWALLPSVAWPAWGRVLFCAADLATGVLLERSLLSGARGLPPRAAALYAASFTLHPFVLNVSTRGNADGLVAAAVVGALAALAAGAVAVAGVAWGLAVHLKLYPVVHALPIGLWLLTAEDATVGVPSPSLSPSPSPSPPRTRRGKKLASTTPTTCPIEGGGGCLQRWWAAARARSRRVQRLHWRRALSFGAAAACTLACLTAGCYAAYGSEFVTHAVAYHATRVDPRHNFSPWFLPVYLLQQPPPQQQQPGGSGGGGSGGSGNVGVSPEWWAAGAAGGLSPHAWLTPRTVSLAAFAPQAALVVWLGAAYASDLPFALLAQTLAFVACNKVATAQYVMWHAALLPLALPQSRMRWRTGVAIAGAWLICEVRGCVVGG